MPRRCSVCRTFRLRDFNAEGYDIVVNATPVGRDTDEAPFELETMNDDAVVIDLVYGARPTPLVGTTRARQQVAIDGRDVLVTQVRHQFRLMTGKEMSISLAREDLTVGAALRGRPRLGTNSRINGLGFCEHDSTEGATEGHPYSTFKIFNDHYRFEHRAAGADQSRQHARA